MFGSKLRSWMENHITRSRKKGNKSKNVNSTSTSSSSAAGCSSTSHDAYKKTVASGFTIYHHGNVPATGGASITGTGAPGNGNVNHNGCGSISSPVRRREVSPIQNHTQSRYGWQSPDQETVTSPKSDNFLYAPPHHHRVRGVHHSAPNSKENSCAKQEYQQQPDCSSSSISSLSWSTGSKEPTSSYNHKQTTGHKMLKVPSIEIHHNNSSANSTSDMYGAHIEEELSAVHYEEIHTILRHPENMANNNFVDVERPKSEQLSSFMPRRLSYENKSQDDASTRYGRLLPSRMQPQQHLSGGSNDSLNANHVQLRSGSAECLPSNNNYRPPVGMGNYQHAQAGMLGGATQRSRFRTTNRYVSPGANAGQGHGHGQGQGQGSATCTMGGPHSLSSPESAYSTGYSTDGTSPGAIYTPPEYYINMRTGTHYFPKSINSLAIETQRYKFGLNKIEEMSPIDPPKNSFATVAERIFDIEHNFPHANDELPRVPTRQTEAKPLSHTSPLVLRNTIVLPTLKGFESPSPRQRCRIRTNPWYSTTDTSSSGNTIGTTQLPFVPASASSTTISSSKSALKMELDATSTTSSSGIKSCNEAADKNKAHNGKTFYESSESSSSLTEVENMNMQRTYSPNTIRRKRSALLHSTEEAVAASAGMMLYPQCVAGRGEGSSRGSGGPAECQDMLASDDDATLNEMMGKFDESYVYEKETDILSSDSDPTDCLSELDTGQDAGDECDTDELLDIDFIDTSSIQEIYEKNGALCNSGSCYYYSSPTRQPRQQMEARASVRSRRRSVKSGVRSADGAPIAGDGGGGSQRRRKRFMKTRKKSAENKEQQFNSPLKKSRESRSLGGTPVCLRRNQAKRNERIYKTSPLSNRSSSLVFTDVRESRFMTIAESEKALLKADLEADVKYRQLILEAESILVSMKNSMQSIPRDTPVNSPRRVNPLANKRVEMLKNCEAETKREQLKQQPQQRSSDAEQELAAAINRRIELLKYETALACASAPNSPKINRLSPRKTHLTNFMNQNAPEVPLRKAAILDFPKPPQSPQLQLNGRRMQSPNGSPFARRRFRSQSPKMSKRIAARMTLDSDSEDSLVNSRLKCNLNGVGHFKRSIEDVKNQNFLKDMARCAIYDAADYTNQNANVISIKEGAVMPFKSVGGGMMSQYCPQSEPLKRKVYKGSSTFERIKKSFDLEAEIPKQAILAKIHHMRRERENSSQKLSLSAKSSSHDLNHTGESPSLYDDDLSTASNISSSKKQMILNTIADLKRSLENQSVELNGLNED